jgi:hypothetical protein
MIYKISKKSIKNLYKIYIEILDRIGYNKIRKNQIRD